MEVEDVPFVDGVYMLIPQWAPSEIAQLLARAMSLDALRAYCSANRALADVCRNTKFYIQPFGLADRPLLREGFVVEGLGGLSRALAIRDRAIEVREPFVLTALIEKDMPVLEALMAGPRENWSDGDAQRFWDDWRFLRIDKKDVITEENQRLVQFLVEELGFNPLKRLEYAAASFQPQLLQYLIVQSIEGDNQQPAAFGDQLASAFALVTDPGQVGERRERQLQTASVLAPYIVETLQLPVTNTMVSNSILNADVALAKYLLDKMRAADPFTPTQRALDKLLFETIDVAKEGLTESDILANIQVVLLQGAQPTPVHLGYALDYAMVYPDDNWAFYGFTTRPAPAPDADFYVDILFAGGLSPYGGGINELIQVAAESNDFDTVNALLRNGVPPDIVDLSRVSPDMQQRLRQARANWQVDQSEMEERKRKLDSMSQQLSKRR